MFTPAVSIDEEMHSALDDAEDGLRRALALAAVSGVQIVWLQAATTTITTIEALRAAMSPEDELS